MGLISSRGPNFMYFIVKIASKTFEMTRDMVARANVVFCFIFKKN